MNHKTLLHTALLTCLTVSPLPLFAESLIDIGAPPPTHRLYGRGQNAGGPTGTGTSSGAGYQISDFYTDRGRMESVDKVYGRGQTAGSVVGTGTTYGTGSSDWQYGQPQIDQPIYDERTTVLDPYERGRMGVNIPPGSPPDVYGQGMNAGGPVGTGTTSGSPATHADRRWALQE